MAAAHDRNSARVLPTCRISDVDTTWLTEPPPGTSVSENSEMFEAFDGDGEPTRPFMRVEDASGIRISPRALTESSLPPVSEAARVTSLPPPHPEAVNCLESGVIQLPPSPFDLDLDLNNQPPAQDLDLWNLEPQPRLEPAVTTRLVPTSPRLVVPPPAPEPPRQLLEVGLGRLSESNLYTGFEPIHASGGVFIATHQHLPLGYRVAVRVHFANAHSIYVEGFVHWARELRSGEGAPGLGVRFCTLGDDAYDIVDRFMGIREPLFFPDC